MRFEFIFFFCLAEITGTFGRSARIVGGENADIKDFPYSVSLTMLNIEKHFCGGAIISNWHIITAAHCIKDRQHSLIRIYMGSSNLQVSGEQGYGIMNVIIHPMFTGEVKSPSILRHDIAIIMVDRCIQFNEFQNKVNLPTRETKTESDGVISGWGRTQTAIKKNSEILQKAPMKILLDSQCHQVLPFVVHEEQVCAFQSKGVGACYGDSGAPLVSNGELIGIGSYVRPCATGIPDVYTRIHSYMEFITSVLTISKLLSCTGYKL